MQDRSSFLIHSQMKPERCSATLWPLLAGAVACLGACTPDPSKLQASYGPWEPLHHGSPPAGPYAPVSRIIRSGTGPKVEPGMMIEATVVTTFGEKQTNVKPRDKVKDLRSRWIYVDFDADDVPKQRTIESKTSEDAAANIFRAGKNRFAASFIGMPLGHKVTFAPFPDQKENRSIVGETGIVPFGAFDVYVDRKPSAREYGQPVYARTDQLDNETSFEIVRACKGSAAQRLVTLLDTTEITIAQDIGRTHTTAEPRWLYLREARWTGVCNDGKAMHFDFGPVTVKPPQGKTTGLGISELYWPWVRDAWGKIQMGVRPGP